MEYKSVGDKYFLRESRGEPWREVTKAEADKAFPDKPIKGFACAPPSCWPMKSEALAVDPSQVKEYQEFAQAGGVQTDFQPTGEPIFRDRNHRKRYLRLVGFHDRNAGYGD